MLYPSGAETGIFRYNKVDDVAADTLAPCVARSSAAMMLIMQHRGFLVCHKKRFEVPEMIGSTIIFLIFQKINSACRNLIPKMLNCFKNYKQCIHISYLILGCSQHDTKFTMEQPYMLPILYCQYHACWCPGDLRARASAGMILTPRHGIFSSIRRVNILWALADIWELSGT